MPLSVAWKNLWNLFPEQERAFETLIANWGLEPRDRLAQSFTHRSAVTEARTRYGVDERLPCYERLEFLGDSVLALIITEMLIEKFPTDREGDLSRIRAHLVNEKTLSGIARRFGFEHIVIMGSGEYRSGAHRNAALMCDLAESFLGGVYREFGLEAAKDCVFRFFDDFKDSSYFSESQDFKTMLQEIVQAEHKVTPTYVTIGHTGPDHERVFEVAVCLNEKELARGTGLTKKQASQNAAEAALATCEKGQWVAISSNQAPG